MVASISAVSSAGAAASYYGKDNYYAKDRDSSDESAWSGKGASALGLSGRVDVKTFERVMRGETLDGRMVGQREKETLEQAAERTHRPGVDLTFSPAKDVSLLLYLGGDKRLLSAHDTAVDQTLKWAERNMAGTRMRLPPKATEKEGDAARGRVVAVKTGNWVAAKFQHDISRDRDPQLHTHVVIANMTRAADGSWRALHNDPLFAHRKTLSLAYDAAMRQQLRALGYQVTLTDPKSGAYRIEGVPEEAKTEFSRARSRIDETMEKLDHDTPAVRGQIAVKTRPSKERLSEADKQADWEERGAPWSAELQAIARQAELNAAAGRQEQLLGDTPVERASLEGAARMAWQNLARPSHTVRLTEDDPYKMERAGTEREVAARAAVSHAIRHLEEREAAFSLHLVRRVAMEHGADGLTLRDVDKELRLLRQSRAIRVNSRDPDGETTTRNSLTNEQRTHQIVRGAGHAKPLVSDIALNARLDETRLTPGQKGAVSLILAGDQRLVGVQGYAGTGKTTMMRHSAALAGDLKSMAGRKDLGILALAPTHQARREIAGSTGVEAQTVQGFMVDQSRGDGPTDLKGQIVIIDESSFLSTRNMNQVLSRVLSLKPERVVLAGDRRQHGAVEAGRPFDIAQRSGLNTAIMKDVVRLPDDEAHRDQRDAVLAAGEGQVRRAMARITGNTVEAPPGLQGERLDQWLAGRAAETWDAWREETGRSPMAIAQGHRMRGLINAEIRGRLMDRGELGEDATHVTVSRSKNLTRAEALSPRSYGVGDVIWFHGRVDRVNTRAGHQRRVVDVDDRRGLITLESQRGTQTVPLDSLVGKRDHVPFSVNETADLELREQDEVLFTRTNREHGIAALDRAQVVGFDARNFTLEMDGEVRTFTRDDPVLQGLTHAYAVNSHAGQGRTAEAVITVQDSREKLLASQVGFYVDISRSADRLEVITDNAGRLTETLERNTGLKSSALDASSRMETLTGLDQPPISRGQGAVTEIEDELDAGERDSRALDEVEAEISEPGDEGLEPPGLDQEISM